MPPSPVFLEKCIPSNKRLSKKIKLSNFSDKLPQKFMTYGEKVTMRRSG